MENSSIYVTLRYAPDSFGPLLARCQVFDTYIVAQRFEGSVFAEHSHVHRLSCVQASRNESEAVLKRALNFCITLANGEVLRQAILSAAENSDDAESLGNNGHGEVYILRFPVETRRGSATVLTVWIIRDGEDFPRLNNLLYTLNMVGGIKMHDVVALLQDVHTKHFESGQA